MWQGGGLLGVVVLSRVVGKRVGDTVDVMVRGRYDGSRLFCWGLLTSFRQHKRLSADLPLNVTPRVPPCQH